MMMSTTADNASNNNSNDYADDDASAEGAIFQSLFGNDDDDDDDDDDDSSSCCSSENEKTKTKTKNERTTIASISSSSPTSTSSSSPPSTSKLSESNNANNNDDNNNNNLDDVFVQRTILHVEIEEQQVGGSIAHRLWPPAEILAQFVIDCAQAKNKEQMMELLGTNNNNRDNNSNRNNNSNNKNSQDPRRKNHKNGDPLQIVETLRQNLIDDDDDDDQHQHQHQHQNENGCCCCPLIELGAGVGLTGLEIATQLNVNVLLTELEEGLPLLYRNCDLNRTKFRRGSEAVQVQQLYWGNDEECQRALDWYRSVRQTEEQPLLLLGSDCVYWQEFHKPLELALSEALSNAPPNSMCLLAGVRRWKSDNAFYQNLGKHTKTRTHRLRCTLLQETIQRTENSREVLRIYAVQWVAR